MWRKVHEADLNASLSLAELDAFRKSADFEHDPVESQIRQVCSYVRGIIRSAPSRVRMAQDEDWLPESLISPAMAKLRFDLLTRMNLPVNESRTKAYEKAEELFDKIRRGEFVPESDGVEDASQDVSGAPAYGNDAHSHLLD